MEADEELAHDGDESLERGLAGTDEVIGKGAQGGVMTSSSQGRHEEGAAQEAIALAGDTGFLFDGAARAMKGRGQAGMGDPLTRIHVGG